MIDAIKFIRHSVSLATATYPSPPTLVMFRRKSTELRLGGFHLRMSSHLPARYLCRKERVVVNTPRQNVYVYKETDRKRGTLHDLLFLVVNSYTSQSYLMLE